jgi:hypothetical protein
MGVLMSDDIGHMERFANFKGCQLLSILIQQQNRESLSMAALDSIMLISQIAKNTTEVNPVLASPGSLAANLIMDVEV